MSQYWIAALAPLVVQFGLFMRWLHRRTRDDEIQRAFVRDMATNHLPHIYDALRIIARGLNIEIEDPPLIQYIQLDGESPRRAR